MEDQKNRTNAFITDFEKKFMIIDEKNIEIESSYKEACDTIPDKIDKLRQELQKETRCDLNDKIDAMKSEIDKKFDISQLNSLRKNIDSKISRLHTAISKKIDEVVKSRKNNDSSNLTIDAAAFKSPYMIYNCLSCDREFK
ncbi:MAG: hypothetical protein MHMPM18_000911 [Marteilia pararefringens]